MEIISAEYLKSSANYTQCPAPEKPEYAHWKKQCRQILAPQYALQQKALAKTSSAPGKTQLINHFIINAPASIKKLLFGI